MESVTESDFLSTVNEESQILTEERATDLGSDREADEEMDSRAGFPPASSGQMVGEFRAPLSVISSSRTSVSGESSESDLSRVLELEVDPEKRCTPAQSKELHVLAEQVKIEALKSRLESETSYYEKEKLKLMLKQSDIRVRTLENKVQRMAALSIESRQRDASAAAENVEKKEDAAVKTITTTAEIHQRSDEKMAKIFEVIDTRNTSSVPNVVQPVRTFARPAGSNAASLRNEPAGQLGSMRGESSRRNDGGWQEDRITAYPLPPITVASNVGAEGHRCGSRQASEDVVQREPSHLTEQHRPQGEKSHDRNREEWGHERTSRFGPTSQEQAHTWLCAS